MAPHALFDLHDTSGYYPSTAHSCQTVHTPASYKSLKAPAPELALNPQTPLAYLGFGSESPGNVWNLSSDEISEVEKNVRHFLGMRTTLSHSNVRRLNSDQACICRSAPSAKRRSP